MSSLYIDRRGVEIETDGEALVLRENGTRVGTVPLSPVSRVFLRGDVKLHANLLGKLGERGIGVVVLSGRKGEASLLMSRPHNDAARRIAQYRFSQDASFCLNFAVSLIRRKVSAQRSLLEAENDPTHRHAVFRAIGRMDAIFAGLEARDSIAALRGAEGAAAAAYFEALAAIAPPRLGFCERNRRPPKDPLNSLLSLGYTLLHNEAVLSIHGAGLDPFVGFYHGIDFGRESLACDLVEPLRAEVERFALDVFRREELRVEDFSTTESGCLLGKNGRAKFYSIWEKMAANLRKSLDTELDSLASTLSAA